MLSFFVAAPTFNGPIASRVQTRSTVAMSAEPVQTRRALLTSAASVALGMPLAAFADGANSKATVEKARAIYGSRVVRLQKAV